MNNRTENMLRLVACLTLWYWPISADDLDLGCSATATANDVARGFNLSGQIALVTGGTGGLGLAAAKTFAKQGATVVIASHNRDRAEATAREIAAASGARVAGMFLDLGKLSTVREFAAAFHRNYTSLNYLLNNAGISGEDSSFQPRPLVKTDDGFEEVFQVNYLGHFLLTELLLPLLRISTPARVINTASSGHLVACLTVGAAPDCFKNWKYLPTPLTLKPFLMNGTERKPWTYGISKFAQIQHASELAVREEARGIEAFSVGPGLVVTGMTNHSNTSGACETFAQKQDPCPYTAEQGAAVLAYTAFQANSPGGWYTRYTGCTQAIPVNMQGFTAPMRAQLYNRSLQWTGL